MILTGSLLLLTILAGSGGHLALSRGMKQVGAVTDLSFIGLTRMVGRAARQGWVWAGIGFNTIAFFSMLALFTREDLSFVIPATALSYVVGTFGACFLLGEQVCWRRWVGVVLVALGVTLTIVGRS